MGSLFADDAFESGDRLGERSEAVAEDAERLAALELSLIPGVGPRTMQQLLEAFGCSRKIIEATPACLREVPGVGPKLAGAIFARRHCEAARQEWDRCRTLGVTLLFRGASDYPRALTEIVDPPPVLSMRGTLLPQDELSVAVVGSRQCTLYGRQVAERLSAALARCGITIISGLARGIDAAAHKGAIDAGGRTLAVLGTGLARIYPPEHVKLADQVAAQGALLTESPLDQVPVKGLFPQRNRLISGLSRGVIIVEAARNSGALHTARHAMEQGRTVFAVPGRIDSLMSEGCHDLIRDGAVLVRNAEDVLAELGPLTNPVNSGAGGEVRNPRELTLTDQERQILGLLGAEPRHIDELIVAAALDASRVLATLTILSVRRHARAHPGGYWTRAEY